MKCIAYLFTLLCLSVPVFPQQKADSLIIEFQQHIISRHLKAAEQDLYHLRNETQTIPPVKALDYFRQAQSIAESHDQHYISGRCYSIMGNFYYEQALYFQAMDYLVKCYKLYLDQGLQDSLGYVYIDIGNVYYAQGLNDIPEQYYRKSVQVFSKIHNPWAEAVALNNIALVKQRRDQWDSASYYFQEALRIRQAMGNSYLIAHSYYYIGKLHRIQKQYGKAEEYLIEGERLAKKALQQIKDQPASSNVRDILFDRADISEILAALQEALGLTYREQGDYEKAILYYLSAVTNFGEHHKSIGSVISIYLSIAETYRFAKDLKNAEKYARKAKDISESRHRTDLFPRALLLLSDIMEMSGRQSDALKHLRQYTALKQEEDNQKRLSKIADYQALLSDYENHILIRQNEQELKLKNTQNLVLLIAFLFMAVTGFILYRFYRNKVKTGRELEEKTKRITEQSRKLETEIAERKEAAAEVRKLATAIEQSANTVVITDINGTIEYVNPRFTEVTGYTAQEALGQNPRILKSRLKKPEEYTELWKTILSGNVWRGLFLNHKKDGTEYWEEATISPIKNDQGEIEHFIAVKEDVTERNRIMQELKESESRYRDLFENSPGLICIHDPDGVLLAVNPSATRALGYDRNELIGKNIGDLVTPANRDRFPLYLKFVKKRKKHTGELHLQSKDKKNLIWLYNNVLIEETGQNPYILGFAQDITALKKLEDEIKTSELQYRTLVESLAEGIGTVDADENFTFANPASCAIFGYTKDELIGTNLKHLMPLDDYRKVMDQSSSRKEGQTGRYELTIIRKNGESRIISVTATPIYGTDGCYEGAFGIFHDITELRHYEKSLRESEERYRTLFSQMRDGLYRTTPNGKFIDANPAYVRMYGYESLDEMRNIDVIRDLYFSAEERDEVNRLSKQGKLTTFRQKKKDGSEMWVEDSGYFIRDDKGEIVFHEGIIRDITQRVKAEEALQESENRHRQLIENINDVLFSLNAQGLITFISKAMLAVSGYKNTDLLGHPFKLFVHPGDLRKADDHFRKVLSGTPDETELRVFKKNKEPFWISVSSSPNLQDGKVTGIQGLLSDISARKLAEDIKNRNEIRLHSLLALSQRSFQMEEKDIIQSALENAVSLTDSKIGYCHFINEDQQSIELVTWSADTLKVCAAVHEKHYPLTHAGVWADCVRQRQPVIHNDYPNLQDKKGLPAGHAELIRHMSVPVIEEEHAKVIMGVGNKDLFYNDSDVQQLQLIANDTWRMVQRKRLEQEREKIIRDLQEAMSKIKTLSGLLPICASCKKIRDDKGYWHQIENYIASHSDADFSHSICKECQMKLYPELFKEEKI